MFDGFEGSKREDKNPESSRQLLKVAVVGTGRMGRCLTRLLRNHCDITLCSRRPDRALSVAKRLGVSASGIKDCIAKNDIIIAAIPTEELQPFAEQVSETMRPGSLFVDISSVKCGVVEVLSRTLPADIEYTSIHPLFASAAVSQKNVIVIPIRGNRWNSHLKQLLASSDMRVTESTAEEHDKVMATVQVLNHFTYLSLRSAMARLNRGQDMEPFKTHAFRKSLAVLKLIEGNLQTVELIQRSNKYAPSVRELFIKEAKRLDQQYRSSQGTT